MKALVIGNQPTEMMHFGEQLAEITNIPDVFRVAPKNNFEGYNLRDWILVGNNSGEAQQRAIEQSNIVVCYDVSPARMVLTHFNRWMDDNQSLAQYDPDKVVTLGLGKIIANARAWQVRDQANLQQSLAHAKSAGKRVRIFNRAEQGEEYIQRLRDTKTARQ